MGDGDSPVCLSVISLQGMRSWLDKLFLWALIPSITLQNAAVDCRRVEINDLPSPNLNSSLNVVRMGQNVSLSCSTKNTSVDITYSLFLGMKNLESKKRKGGTVDFYLRISNTNETGPYKCKITVSNLSKYSPDFNFTIAELPSPNLNSSLNVVRMGQNVSLSCSTKNTSVDITYSLFLGMKHLESKRRRGGTVDFYLRISNTNETGPYKCKTNISNLSKYSPDFNFTIAEDESCPSCRLSLLLSGVLLGLLVIFLVLAFLIHLKYKKGKTLRESESKDSGDGPRQSELYANICETPTGAEQPQEIQYAIPVFKEAAPMEHEGGVDRKADYTYSELIY
ncbi:allergin-1 isoform X2 [Arvicanthis niloticus]|uniref:allergin-1 isoform X2 n=1 Tax=Arvicanthis niloticus TaxID=61156 RepID=UPI001486EC96|nr:allergin-1 [Arvicanthis niloticus]